MKVFLNFLSNASRTFLFTFFAKITVIVPIFFSTDRMYGLAGVLFNFGWLRRLLTPFTSSDWKTESGETWLDEFSQVIKKKKLTFETYHSMRKYDFRLYIYLYIYTQSHSLFHPEGIFRCRQISKTGELLLCLRRKRGRVGVQIV